MEYILFKKTVIRIIPKYCSWHLSHRRRFYKKMPCLMSSKKRWSWPTCKKRWIQGIESQRQTSRKLDANVQNTQPPTRFHPDWNMTKAILFGSPFLGGSKYTESMFFVHMQQSLQIRCENSFFSEPQIPLYFQSTKITHQTIAFLLATGDPNVTGRVRWMFRKKTTGTQRLWAKDASVPRAKVGMSTDLMCPPKKKRS